MSCTQKSGDGLRCRCFFFNDTATTEIYTLSLHDALPIWRHFRAAAQPGKMGMAAIRATRSARSEEHTSELQSPDHLVCRLLLEKTKRDDVVVAEREVGDRHPPLLAGRRGLRSAGRRAAVGVGERGVRARLLPFFFF